MNPTWIEPDWPAPPHVRAAATLRTGGVSAGAYASLNLGSHVGDDPAAVAENRRRIREALRLPAEPLWLNQVHGAHVHRAEPDGQRRETAPTADACVAFRADQICAVLTADCLPVLLSDRDGTCVAAVHAGWRGLVAGVLASTIEALDVQPRRLIAWLGPAIEQEAFEVGAEVRDQFIACDPDNASGFLENARGRWQADIYTLARIALGRLGVADIHGGGWRGYEARERFFSYRRDSRTGRMATMVWLAP